MRYLQLLRFLLPLVLTAIVLGLSGQVLNGGMARMPSATTTLASFGLAWGIVLFLASTLTQTRQLGLVLVHGRSDFKKVQLFVIVLGLLLTGAVVSLAITPLGTWVIEDLHGVDRSLGEIVRRALLWLMPIPVLSGLLRFYSGVLIRARRTDIVSYATLTNIGASIVTVFVLLPTTLIRQSPILLPLIVTYAGLLLELAIVYGGYRRFVTYPLASRKDKTLSIGYIFRFFWPLALIMAIQGFSRPLINLFVSRETDGAQALAVLTVAYALGHLPYGWLNEIRNLAPAFQNERGSLVRIRRFAAGCGLVSTGLMFALFWTPLREYILSRLIGLDAPLAAQAAVPLMIFSFFPLAVTIRAYLHGVGLVEHRTQAMAPSAPSRIGAILLALLILPLLGLRGATLGVTALYCGFVVETIAVWWGVTGKQLRQQKVVVPSEHPSY